MVCTTTFPPLITWVEHGTMGGVEHVGKMVCTTSFPPLITRVEHGAMGGVEHGTMGGVEHVGKWCVPPYFHHLFRYLHQPRFYTHDLITINSPVISTNYSRHFLNMISIKNLQLLTGIPTYTQFPPLPSLFNI